MPTHYLSPEDFRIPADCVQLVMAASRDTGRETKGG